MRARRRALTALTLAVGLTLTACTGFPLPGESTSTVETTDSQFQGDRPAGPPLPAGALLEQPGEVSPAQNVDQDVVGSLRPDDRTPEERVPRIVERGRLIVGVDQSQNLLSSRDVITGRLIGFEVDLAREIARDIFGDPEAVDFRFIDSVDRARPLDAREVDIIIRTLTITEERQEVVEFSAPYLSADTRMLVADPNIRGYGDLSGRVVCVADDTAALDKARAAAPYSILLKTRRWSDCLYALQERQVDAIISDTTILSGIAEQDPYTTITGESLGSENYGVGIRKSTPGEDSSGLVRQVNSTLERIRADGTWWRMYEQWFSTNLTTAGPPDLYYREEEPADAYAADDAPAEG